MVGPDEPSPRTPPDPVADEEHVEKDTAERSEPEFIEASDDAEAPDPAKSLALAKEAMELRRVQARAALVEEVEPEENQLQAFDGAMSTMNAALLEIADDFVATVGEGEEPSRREIMGFAADTLDVLITADDAVHGVLDADQVAAASESSLDPFSYVDPQILDILSEVVQ